LPEAFLYPYVAGIAGMYPCLAYWLRWDFTNFLLGLAQIMILLISASHEAGITVMYHHAQSKTSIHIAGKLGKRPTQREDKYMKERN
jgi:hypothetical protein